MALIDIGDVTTGSLDGTGYFDILMRTVSLHLQREWTGGRITGDVYAKAYLEALNNALNQAIGFVISVNQAAVNEDLIRAQIDQTRAQIDQIIAQVAQMQVQEDLIRAQVAQMQVQEDQIRAQIELIGYQGNAEQAKYKDVVDGLTVAGSIGKQKDVYSAQIKGFKDSALQSVAKTMMDIWSVQRSTDDGIRPTPESKLYDGNIGNAVEEMLKNLSIPVAAPPNIPSQSLKVGTAYSFDVSPYFSLSSGEVITAYSTSSTLPAGITLTADGILSGTPTTAGSSVVTIVGSRGSESVSRTVTMAVAAAS